ncbi:MAG: hypothetical protein OEL91_10710 [Burkholderiaceae bacterium]|nr:hypothetical protein [Burkholderiaceae bacterium]
MQHYTRHDQARAAGGAVQDQRLAFVFHANSSMVGACAFSVRPELALDPDHDVAGLEAPRGDGIEVALASPEAAVPLRAQYRGHFNHPMGDQ